MWVFFHYKWSFCRFTYKTLLRLLLPLSSTDRLIHRRIKGGRSENLAGTLMVTVRILCIAILSGPDSVACPVSLKRRITACYTRDRMLVICSRIIFSSLADDTGYVHLILQTECSSDAGLLTNSSNVSPPSALRTGMARSSNAAFINETPLVDLRRWSQHSTRRQLGGRPWICARGYWLR